MGQEGKQIAKEKNADSVDASFDGLSMDILAVDGDKFLVSSSVL